MAVPYEALTFEAAAKYKIPPSLLAAQQFVESGFRPGAVSSAGAFGLTQFMPGTAPGYGVKRGTSPAAVRTQIMGQARYLIEAGFRKNPSRALGAYVGGPGNPDHPWYWNRVFAAQKKFRGMDARFAALQRGGGPAPVAGAPAGVAPAGVAAPVMELPERQQPQIAVSAPMLPQFAAGPPTAGAPAMLPSMPPQAPRGIRDALSAIQAPAPLGAAPTPGSPSTGRSAPPGRGRARLSAAGGGWQGTEKLVSGVATPIAQRMIGTAGRGKRGYDTVGGSGVSDHFTGKKNAYARDYPTNDLNTIYATGRAVARAYGVKFVPNTYSSGGTVRTAEGTFKVQILGGPEIDHADHLHVGVEKIG